MNINKLSLIFFISLFPPSFVSFAKDENSNIQAHSAPEISVSYLDSRNRGIGDDYGLQSKEGSKKITVKAHLRGFDKIVNASAKLGPDFQSSLPDNGWKRNSFKCSWIFLLDVTDVAKNSIVVEELRTVRNVISCLPAGDEIGVYALGTTLKKWGSASGENTSERSALLAKLEKMEKNKDFGDNSFRNSSLIFSGLRQSIKELTSAGKSGKGAIVLISDGMDETGGTHGATLQIEERRKAIEEAQAAKLHVSTLGFAYRSADRGGYPALKEISDQTGGVHFSANLDTKQLPDMPIVSRSIINCVHERSGELTVDLGNLSLANEIKIVLQSDSGTLGELYIPKTYVAEAIKKLSVVDKPKAPAINTLDKEEKDAENALLKVIKQSGSIGDQLKILKEKESDLQIPKEELIPLAEELRKTIAIFITDLKGLVEIKKDLLNKVIAKRQESSKNEKGILEKVSQIKTFLELLKNEHAIFSEKTILNQMGRTDELPDLVETTPPSQQLLESIPNWIWGFVSMGGILLGGLIILVRRKKSPANEPIVAEPAGHVENEDRTVLLGRTPSSLQNNFSHKALLVSSDGSGRWEIDQPSVKIGRGRHNDICLTNDTISSSHCVIRCNRDGIWFITDLESGNGVFVNNKRVAQIHLGDGALIELGDIKLRFDIIS